MIRLTLLGRPDCHLCEAMLAELGPLIKDRASVEIVNIDEDEALLRKYMLEIPVLLHGEHELARHRLDRDAVARCLDQNLV
jgi:hypothetical protein